MSRNILITGTDTGVGKTVVSAALVQYFSNQQKIVSYYKPIQTGAIERNGILIAEDIEFVNCLTGYKFTTETNCSYLLRAPMSPWQAAIKELITIDLDKIKSDFDKLYRSSDIMITEGSGGLLVPITDKIMMIDMISQLNAEVIVAVRPGLGTINHSLLTIQTLKNAKIKALGFLVCGYPSNPDLVEQENPAMIEKFSGLPFLGFVPWCDSLDNLKQKLFLDLKLNHF